MAGYPLQVFFAEVVSLRERAGQDGYAGGFIEHYVLGIIYPEGITRTTQMLLAALLIVGNIVVYTVWARRRAGVRRAAAAAQQKS